MTATALLLACLLAPQAAGAPSQKQIDDAVKRGVEYLKTAPSPGGHLKTNCDELILLTLIHAGMSEKNPVFEKLLSSVLSQPLEKTYKVALLAMCLEELDPAYYQPKIAQCAQFLVDCQATNGQWSYGRPTDAVNTMPGLGDKPVSSKEKKPGVLAFGERGPKSVPRTVIVITQTKTAGEKGDNSNSQYAALGLRACHDAKVRIPDSVIHLARKWWIESQHPPEDGADAKAVISGEGARPQGWNYTALGAGENGDRKPYHAMTAGAIGATVILESMLNRDWKKDKTTNGGLAWLAKHWSVNTNYYYMYALERAGMLYGVESIGNHNWYFEGARVLLQNQNDDGSWGKRENKEENTWDTCFAILFLKKATRAIATGK